jgi:hypothetical protein
MWKSGSHNEAMTPVVRVDKKGMEEAVYGA